VPFLTLLFGMIQYSLWFYSGQSGAAAAYEAARRAAVGDLTCAQLTSTAQSHSELVTEGFSVTRKYFAPNSTTARTTDTTIQGGDDVQIVVQYETIDMNLPFIPVPNDGQINEVAVGRLENLTTRSTTC
jgi:Flp pilus assembly protein TadG